MKTQATPPDLIRAWLKEHGRKKGWLASQLQVNGSTLTRWLTGDCAPKDISRTKLAQITGLDIAGCEPWGIEEGNPWWIANHKPPQIAPGANSEVVGTE